MKSIPILLCVTLKLSTTACKAYQVPSTAMEPTILAGDYIFVRFSTDKPRRQELLAYRRAEVAYIKRVVGLPGDTLSMRNGILFVNGDSIPEPYASHVGEESVADTSFGWQRSFLVRHSDSGRYHPTLTFWGPIVLPERAYFVLGDNRGNSADSRFTGPLNESDFFARPVFIYFSRDRRTGKIRWGR